MKKLVVLFFTLFSFFNNSFASWRSQIVHENNHDPIHTIAFFKNDIVFNSSNIYFSWLQYYSDCLMTSHSHLNITSSINNRWETSRISEMEVLDSIAYFDSSSVVELFWTNFIREPSIKGKKLFYTKFDPIVNRIIVDSLIYENIKKNVIFVFPAKLFVKSNKKYLFVVFAGNEQGNVLMGLKYSLHYFIQENNKWKGPFDVIPLSKNPSNFIFNVDGSGILNLFWEERRADLSSTGVYTSKFDGENWSNQSTFISPKFTESSDYVLDFSGNLPFIFYTERFENSDFPNQIFFSYKESNQWSTPIRLERSLLPENLQKDRALLGVFSVKYSKDGFFHISINNDKGILYGRVNKNGWSKMMYVSNVSKGGYDDIKISIDNNDIVNIFHSASFFAPPYTRIMVFTYYPMEAPSSLKITRGENKSVFRNEYFDKIEWLPPSNSDPSEVDHYSLYVKQDTNTDFILLVNLNGNETSYTNRNLNSKNYRYAIKATDIYGNESNQRFSE